MSDLLRLATHHEARYMNFSFDYQRLRSMVPVLRDLQDMIGLDNIKENIVEFIVYHLQDLYHRPVKRGIPAEPSLLQIPSLQHNVGFGVMARSDPNLRDQSETDFINFVICGPPGCGKTELAKILGRICLHLGICWSDAFVAVRRQDLVAEFLGQTAIKTQKVIDRAMGGVLFIDEAYSLGYNSGNSKQTDSYSMEAINTLNQNLSEHKGQFVTIIAGYEKELEERFFSMNPGLARRFQHKFRINGYTSKELLLMFFKMVRQCNWRIDPKTQEQLIKEDFFSCVKNDLKCYGGDVHRLLFNIKIEHGKRVFADDPFLAKTVTREDIVAGIARYKRSRESEVYSEDSHIREAFDRMYI